MWSMLKEMPWYELRVYLQAMYSVQYTQRQ